MVRELLVCLAAVTCWTLVRMRFLMAILVGWWAVIGLGLAEGSPGPLLVPSYLVWGLAGWAGGVWLWSAKVLFRGWVRTRWDG